MVGAGIAAATGVKLQAATTQANISNDDIAAMDRILGRNFSQPERQMMEEGLDSRRKLFDRLRRMQIGPEVEPAVQFDPRLPGTKIPVGPSVCVMSRGKTPSYNGNAESLAFASVVNLSRLIHARKVTSVQLTKMYLERLKRIGPKLYCVITLTEELAMSQAQRADRELAAGKSRGPLHGIPWGAKDLFATRGIRTTWGAKPYINQVFDYDATVVKKLEEAGAVLLAKLSMGELAMGDVWFGGMTRCPWNTKEGSGGSSAGPAAATAAGLVGFALGTETMGSIVSPCMINGTTGLRPTYGRVSRHGAMPLARTLDKVGPICRGVEDCALVLSAIAEPEVAFRWEPDIPSEPLRVGFNPAAFDEMAKDKNKDKAKAYARALEKLTSIAGKVTPIKLPDPEKFSGIAGLIIAAEAACDFCDLLTSGKIHDLKQQDEGSWPNTFRKGSLIPAADYLRAMQVRAILQEEMAAAMEDVDLYINIPYSGPTLSFTNLTGHPTLIARCGMVEGRPVMIELLGNLNREDAILRLGRQYERATDWGTVWPKVG